MISKSLDKFVYYKSDEILLLHGDALSVLPLINNVDVIITDPPFNAGREFDNDNLKPEEWKLFCDNFAQLCRRSNAINILVEVGKQDPQMYNSLQAHLIYEFAICLNYTNNMRQGKIGFSNWGLVYWFSCGQGKCYTRYMDRLDSPLTPTKDEFTHPTPKQIKHYSHLVRMFSQKGHIVVDPFIGSGTTAIACKNLRRRFIGIDKREEYLAITKKRLLNTHVGFF